MNWLWKCRCFKHFWQWGAVCHNGNDIGQWAQPQIYSMPCPV